MFRCEIENKFSQELRQEWDNFFEKGNYWNYQYSYEWIFNWRKLFLTSADNISIFKIYDDSELISIIPLFTKRTFLGCTELQLLGGWLTDYHEFLILKKYEEVINYFFIVLKKRYKRFLLNLYNFLDRGVCYEILKRTSKGKGFFIKDYFLVGTSEILFEHFQELDKELSTKARGEIKRRIRRLEELGTLRFEILPLTSELFSELKEINISRRGKNGFTTFLTDKKITNFIKNLMPTKNIVADCLFLDNKCISYILGFDFRQRFFVWNTSFLVEYMKYSPGTILRYYLINYLKNRSYISVDFMRGIYDYKRIWPVTESTNRQIYIFNFFIGKILAFCYWDMKYFLKKNKWLVELKRQLTKLKMLKRHY